MSIDTSTVLSTALAYLDMGLSVFPLAPREKKPPRQFKWEPLQHRLPTQEQVMAWFDRTDNNVVVVTGKISRLIFLDVDGDKAKSYAENVIRTKVRQGTKEAIDNTLWTETGGGGYHFLIRYNPEEFDNDDSAAGEIKNAVLWRGCDSHSEVRLKSDGSYVIFPPSVHPTGNAYRFDKGNDIVVLSKEQLLDLIRALRGMNISRVRIHNIGDRMANNVSPAPAFELDEERVMDAVVILKPYYFKGQRYDGDSNRNSKKVWIGRRNTRHTQEIPEGILLRKLEV